MTVDVAQFLHPRVVVVVKGAAVTQDLARVYVLVTVFVGLHAIFGQVVGKTVDVDDAGQPVATALAVIGATVGMAKARVLWREEIWS